MPIKDPQQNRDYQREWARRKADEINTWLAPIREQGCILCGETQKVEFHHVFPETKVFTVGGHGGRLRTRQAIDTEVSKCVLLCMTCHNLIHARKIQLPESVLQEYKERAEKLGYTVSIDTFMYHPKRGRLTEEQVRDIRSRNQSGAEIGRELGISRHTINRIRNKTYYPYIT